MSQLQWQINITTNDVRTCISNYMLHKTMSYNFLSIPFSTPCSWAVRSQPCRWTSTARSCGPNTQRYSRLTSRLCQNRTWRTARDLGWLSKTWGAVRSTHRPSHTTLTAGQHTHIDPSDLEPSDLDPFDLEHWPRPFWCWTLWLGPFLSWTQWPWPFWSWILTLNLVDTSEHDLDLDPSNLWTLNHDDLTLTILWRSSFLPRLLWSWHHWPWTF